MFRLHNPLVVFDLEATIEEDDRGFLHHNEIVDLGAVYLNERLEVVAEFSSLVRARAPVTPRLAQLTGLRQEEVDAAPEWGQVAERFEAWVSAQCGAKIKKVRLCSWGSSFDITLLRRQYRDLGRELPFSGTVVDVKSLCFLRRSLAGERTDRLDLDELAVEWGLSLPAHRHRALPDARLTAEVLRKVWADLQGFWVPTPQGPWRHCRVEVS